MIMRFITILMTMFFLSSLNVSAGGSVGGNLNGKREGAIEPLVEELRKAKFGKSNKVRHEKRRGKKAKRG